MYWPTTIARRLHISPSGLHQALDHHKDDWQNDRSAAGPAAINAETENSSASIDTSDILYIDRAQQGHLWAALSPTTLSVWSIRPAHVIAAIQRTSRSIEEYGANKRLHWRSSGRGIVIETDQSYLLLYTLHFLPPREAQCYSYVPPNGSSSRSSITKEPLAPSIASMRASFTPGAGERLGNVAAELLSATTSEGLRADDGRHLALDIRFHLVLRIDAGLSTILPTPQHLIVFTVSPPAIQCIAWPDESSAQDDGKPTQAPRTTLVERLDWIVRDVSDVQRKAPHIAVASYSEPLGIFVFLTSDGRAYWAQVEFDSRTAIWRGKCFHGLLQKRRRTAESFQGIAPAESTLLQEGSRASPWSIDDHAITASCNARFNLLAVGTRSGTVCVYSFRSFDRVAPLSHKLSIREAMRSTASYLTTGPCTSLAWTSDGYALAVGWAQGWSAWSTFGKLMGSSLMESWQEASSTFSDNFMLGVSSLFWGPGDTDLFVACGKSSTDGTRRSPDGQLFALPFAKSAMAGQHSPDNTRYAFVQLDDSVLVYRGSDQPDMSIINPESDVWQTIKVPASYMATNWPMKYACISGDGRLIAVAGRRGLTHFSTLSGRWKQYVNPFQEQSFSVQGGLQWYQHVLVAACHVEATDTFEIRLLSRDANLNDSSTLYIEELSSAVILTSLFDNSLLVYTADNTMHHYLIAILEHDIRLTFCGSITFEGVVGEPERVRGMSWLVPHSHQRFGDPMDDLMVATIIFLIDGKLVLLRPRRGRGEEEEEVSYDMQILDDRIEYYWTHLQGIGTLENSLWGYDGQGIKLWLDALTIEQADVINENDDDDDDKPEYRTIAESLSIPLDFYPLCVLIEKGIIIGIEPEVSLRRSLDFAIFRSITITKLFVQHVLRNYLERSQLHEAVLFASFYKDLVYFAHALEMLLHDILEDEADASHSTGLVTSSSSESVVEHAVALHGAAADEIDQSTGKTVQRAAPHINLMSLVVAFLDHFDESLDVVVNCARKTEIARWKHLFLHVGQPRDLFEICLSAGNYKTAGSYLLVLHNLESLDASHQHTVRLLKLAREHGWHNLCRDLLRFSRSLDEEGRALRRLVKDAGLDDACGAAQKLGDGDNHALPTNGTTLTTPSTPRRTRPAPSNRTVSTPHNLDVPMEEDEYGEEGRREVEDHEGARLDEVARENSAMASSLPDHHSVPPHYASDTNSPRSSAENERRRTSRARLGHSRHPESVSVSAQSLASGAALDAILGKAAT